MAKDREKKAQVAIPNTYPKLLCVPQESVRSETVQHVSTVVFVGLPVPVCPRLCFSGIGRSLELFAPGSRTVVRGSGCCLRSPEHVSQSHRTTGGEEGASHAPCAMIVASCSVFLMGKRLYENDAAMEISYFLTPLDMYCSSRPIRSLTVYYPFAHLSPHHNIGLRRLALALHMCLLADEMWKLPE
ncbi:unnamed protein product [Pleuronectes platessa]|uniref:Uncharacterized protein n=1 Tax=Pleuronectes platessa TaxID=8262 RepID=A0A9N7TKX2_PLEPL|nr:unnamed protein product [Pleuronectes platessa]